jgi:hypothetical protein
MGRGIQRQGDFADDLSFEKHALPDYSGNIRGGSGAFVAEIAWV